MRPLTLLLDVTSHSYQRQKTNERRIQKIKSSDAEQHSVLTSLAASLGKSHAVTLVSITSPQLRRCSHTHRYESKFASSTAFGAFHILRLSTFNCHTSAILLHPPFKPVKNHPVLLYHVSTSYGVPWHCGLVGFVCCF